MRGTAIRSELDVATRDRLDRIVRRIVMGEANRYDTARRLMRGEEIPGGVPPVRLSDGTLGYFVRMPRTDDCLAAAIATTLQVPIEEVPDPRIEERLAAGDGPDEIRRSAWQELSSWLARRGLRVMLHRKLPVRRRRWIGIVPAPGDFNDHCLVMERNNILFDPALCSDWLCSVPLPGALGPRLYRPENIAYGLSFASRLDQAKERIPK